MVKLDEIRARDGVEGTSAAGRILANEDPDAARLAGFGALVN